MMMMLIDHLENCTIHLVDLVGCLVRDDDLASGGTRHRAPHPNRTALLFHHHNCVKNDPTLTTHNNVLYAPKM